MKRPAFLVTSLLLGTAAGLLLGEAGLRLLEFRFQPFPETVQFGWPDPRTLEKRYRVDAELLWVPRDYRATLARWEGRRPDIALLGDSCTEFGSYDRRLGEMVGRVRGRRRVRLLNVGVGGWSSFQGLRQLERDVAPLRPRIVTIYFGWNDHWKTFGIPDAEIARFHRYRDPEEPLRRLRLVQLVDALAFRQRLRAERGSRLRVPLASFRGNLTAMVREARRSGAVPVLVTAASNHRQGEEPAYLAERHLDDLGALVPLHRRYVEALREVARAEGAALADAARRFDAVPPRIRSALFMEDGLHLRPAGNRLLAAVLFQALDREGLLERIPVSPGPAAQAAARP